MSKLCRFCAGLSISSLVELAEDEFKGHVFPEHWYYEHHRSFANLEESAKDGCPFCSLILGCAENTSHEVETLCLGDLARELEVSDIKISINSDHVYLADPIQKVDVFDTIMIQIGASDESDPDNLSPLKLRMKTPRDDPVVVGRYRIGAFQVDPDLESTANFEIARQWLSNCLDHHPDCSNRHDSELPTRVIRVGTADGAVPPRIALPQTGTRAPYMALSHCWGGSVSPMLTTETLDTFQNMLPYQNLPANFQDAITITRQLGIDYLWVDCLCILQDSKQDWAQQSKNMGLIYRNSTVTIFAMASGNSKDGILSRMTDPVPNTEPIDLRIASDRTQESKVFVEIQDPKEEDLNRLNSPLTTRGWTLQESIFSPRQLYYGNRQIYWRCPEGYQSSDGFFRGNKFPNNQYDEVLRFFNSNSLPPVLPEHNDVNRLLTAYYHLVEDYSGRRLTFDSDKLPAFSALSGRLHDLIGGQFLAGLWSSDIHNALCWYKELQECRHVRSYRAPSWSWAVTNDPVIFSYGGSKTDPRALRLIDFDVNVRDKTNPYGEIISARLTVEGLTMRLTRSRQVVQSYGSELQIGSVRYDEVETDVERLAALFLITHDDDSDSSRYLLSISREIGPGSNWSIDFDCYSVQSYLALLVNVEDTDADGVFTSRTEGLVLRPTNEVEQLYERVGYFSIEPFLHAGWLRRWSRKTVNLV